MKNGFYVALAAGYCLRLGSNLRVCTKIKLRMYVKGRVTRWGEFSPIGRLLSSGIFLKMLKAAKKITTFSTRKKVMH
jgi:hypothetical protein